MMLKQTCFTSNETFGKRKNKLGQTLFRIYKQMNAGKLILLIVWKINHGLGVNSWVHSQSHNTGATS
jgi:hypothetical protein